MHDGVLQYQKKLRKALRCPRKTQIRLMVQFRDYQRRVTAEISDPTYAQLVTAFGPPEEMAGELMRDVASQEHRAYQRQTLLRRVIFAVLLLTLVGFSIYITFYKHCHTVVFQTKDYIYIDGTPPTTQIMSDESNSNAYGQSDIHP